MIWVSYDADCLHCHDNHWEKCAVIITFSVVIDRGESGVIRRAMVVFVSLTMFIAGKVVLLLLYFLLE